VLCYQDFHSWSSPSAKASYGYGIRILSLWIPLGRGGTLSRDARVACDSGRIINDGILFFSRSTIVRSEIKWGYCQAFVLGCGAYYFLRFFFLDSDSDTHMMCGWYLAHHTCFGCSWGVGSQCSRTGIARPRGHHGGTTTW
jgi:hypothetical protein